MFQFPGLASTAYVFSGGFWEITPRGFPHSEIPGSKPASGSPRLIAANHVLHRLLAPRHPPYALSSLTELEISCPQSILRAFNDYANSRDSIVKEQKAEETPARIAEEFKIIVHSRHRF